MPIEHDPIVATKTTNTLGNANAAQYLYVGSMVHLVNACFSTKPEIHVLSPNTNAAHPKNRWYGIIFFLSSDTESVWFVASALANELTTGLKKYTPNPTNACNPTSIVVNRPIQLCALYMGGMLCPL